MRKIFFALVVIIVFTFGMSFYVPKSVQAISPQPAPTYAPSSLDNLVKELTDGILGRYDKSGHHISGGAVDFFSQSINTLVSTPPASSMDYVRYFSQRFHVPGTPSPVYAVSNVGIGYNALAPVLPFWTTMRNLAYFFFAIFFVIAGIMIMIRSKIDPKTAVTIQSVLPGIVLSLILVTFSYAIAGFLIDLMYVAIGLVITIAGQIPGPAAEAVKNGFTDNVAKNTIFSFFIGPGTTVSFNAAGAVTNVVSNFIKSILGEVGGAFADLIGSAGGTIAFFIIAIAILWALFKTWLVMLTAYGQTILGIIFAPVRIMFDAIPGQNQFESWVREMLANLIVFPAVIAMIFIALALSDPSNAYTAGNGFVPPLIGGNSQPAIQALLGMMILLTTPKVLEILQQILKAPQNKWGNAWGEAIGFGRGFVQGTAAGSYGAGRDIAFGGAAARRAEKRKDEAKGLHPAVSLSERIGSALGAKPRG